jgi:hypothetical protein
MAKIIEGVGMIVGLGVAAFLDPALIPFLIEIEPAVLGLGASMVLLGIAAEFASGNTNSVSVREAAGSRQVIYGQTRASGTVVYWASTNSNSQLNQICIWASHTLQSIDNLYLDNRRAYWAEGNGPDPTVYGTNSLLDSSDHYDDAGNKYNFKGKAAASHTLGSSAGYWFQDLYNRTNNSGNGGAIWDSTCTLNGLAATYCRAEYDSSIFNSPPNLQADVHGKCDIYDPRLGAQFLSDGVTPNPATHIWTNNAALIIADYLCNPDFGFGCNYSVEIDEDQLIAAANICDEQVQLAVQPGAWTANYEYAIGQVIYDSNGRLQTVQGYTNQAIGYSGGSQPTWATTEGATTQDNNIIWVAGTAGQALTESRYTINGSFRYSNNRGDILDSMLMAMEGRISVSGGLIKIYPAAWYGTSLEFDAGDLIGPVKWTPRRKFRDLFNTVRATYVSPVYPYMIMGLMSNGYRDPNVFSGEYQPTDAPEYAQDALHGYTSDPNLAQDGGTKLYMDRRYQFVQSCATAQRLMKIFLLRNRWQGTGTLQMNLAAYQTQACEAIQMSFPLLGWDNKNLEVTNFRFVPKIQYNEEGKESPTLACELDVCETDPSIYTWSPVEERGMENTNSPFMADSFQVGPPTNLTLDSGLDTAVVGTDGIVTPRILATWTEPDDPFVTTGGHVEVWYQPASGGAEWTSVGKFAGTITQCYITGVVCGHAYNVQVQASRANGAISEYCSVANYTVSDTSDSISSGSLLSNIPFNQSNNMTIMPTFHLSGTSPGYGVEWYGPGGPWTSGTQTLGNGQTVTLPGAAIGFGALAPATSHTLYYVPNTNSYWTTTGDPSPAMPDDYLIIGSFTTMGYMTAWVPDPGVLGGGAVGGMGGPRSGAVSQTPVTGGSIQ